MQAGGSTNDSPGIQLAYDLAAEHSVAEGANRVILAINGDLNGGIISDEALVELIRIDRIDGQWIPVDAGIALQAADLR